MTRPEARPTKRDERSSENIVSHPDLEWRETVKGAKPGDRFVRIATHKGFTRVSRGHLVRATALADPRPLLAEILNV